MKILGKMLSMDQTIIRLFVSCVFYAPSQIIEDKTFGLKNKNKSKSVQVWRTPRVSMCSQMSSACNHTIWTIIFFFYCLLLVSFVVSHFSLLPFLYSFFSFCRICFSLLSSNSSLEAHGEGELRR